MPLVIGARLRTLTLAPVLIAFAVLSIYAAVAQTPGPGATYGDAMSWYTRAAEAGDARAQFLLGLRYETGTASEADERRAAEWFTRAAGQGHTEAQFKLALMYDAGRGVDQDPGEAARWYRSAAEAGLAEAQYNLGVAYLNGNGVVRDVAEAFAWITIAADAGVAEARDLRGRLSDVLAGDIESEAYARAAEVRERLQSN